MSHHISRPKVSGQLVTSVILWASCLSKSPFSLWRKTNPHKISRWNIGMLLWDCRYPIPQLSFQDSFLFLPNLLAHYCICDFKMLSFKYLLLNSKFFYLKKLSNTKPHFECVYVMWSSHFLPFPHVILKWNHISALINIHFLWHWVVSALTQW